MLIATRRGRGLARLGAALAVALGLTTIIATAPADATVTGVIPNGTYRWGNTNSGLCLAWAPNQRGANRQENCSPNGDPTIYWYATNTGGNNYELVSEANGQCLSIWSGNTSDGAPVGIYDCNGTADEIFTLIPSTSPAFPGAYKFQNVHTGKCVAVGGGRTNPGAWIIQWTCNDSGEFMWRPYN
ncbi:RICIN domain-containing protein [Actinokineospora inagensis]|uniref:RICIN domain-containing protein n=1 Tax=Actinokineospora inagensis TaxID=103730 RepID=UPI0004219787|nr:RICIN domain-containing protein [Actinokineospora inagensis]